MKKTIVLLVAFLLLLCGCSQNGKLNQLNVGTFSYLDDCAYYEGAEGVKKTDFVNTEKSKIKDAEQAVEYAKKECTVKYDTICVDYDTNMKVYRVCFYKKDRLGGDQDVYINQDGITQLIVWCE